jgi:hypothetical protein
VQEVTNGLYASVRDDLFGIEDRMTREVRANDNLISSFKEKFDDIDDRLCTVVTVVRKIDKNLTKMSKEMDVVVSEANWRKLGRESESSKWRSAEGAGASDGWSTVCASAVDGGVLTGGSGVGKMKKEVGEKKRMFNELETESKKKKKVSGKKKVKADPNQPSVDEFYHYIKPNDKKIRVMCWKVSVSIVLN